MRPLFLLIFALAATLTLASSNLPRPIKLPKDNPQLNTLLYVGILSLPEPNIYLKELLTWSVNFAIKEGIKRGKLSKKANWALGGIVAIGHLQDSQSDIFFTFDLVAEGKDPVRFVVEVLDDPSKKTREVSFFAIFENLVEYGTIPSLQWPISFSLAKVQDSKFIRSLIRLGIDTVLEKGRKSGVLCSEKYELESLASVSIDVVDGVTFYVIDLSLTLPDYGLADSYFIIKDDPKKGVSVVYASLNPYDLMIPEL